MCQRHQNWFAEYLARGKKTKIHAKVSENSFLTFWNISDHCNSALHVYIAPLKIFRVHTQMVSPKTPWKKKSLYSLRGITHFGAKIYEYHYKGSFSGRAKVMFLTLFTPFWFRVWPNFYVTWLLVKENCSQSEYINSVFSKSVPKFLRSPFTL